jgi:hypothetical protein
LCSLSLSLVEIIDHFVELMHYIFDYVVLIMPWMLAINICETFKLMKNVANLQHVVLLLPFALWWVQKLQKGGIWKVIMIMNRKGVKKMKGCNN